MKADSPKINKQALIELLQSAFAVDVARLTFVPKGEESYSYIAATHAGRNYFVKVHLTSVSPALEADYQFVHHLALRDGFEFIVRPYVTSEGNCLVSLDKYAVVLFDYVTGVTKSPSEFSGRQMEQLAALVVKLHRSVALASGLTKEPYAISFKAWLMEVLEAVDQPPRTNSAWTQRAHDLIRSEKPRILAVLAHSEDIAHSLQTADQDLVVTHGDLGSHNIIEDEQGKFFLIDWSKLRLAPPARDLVELWGNGNAPLLAAYQAAAGGPSTLSKQAVTYYLYYYLLVMVTDYGSWLLLEDASPEEAEHAWKQLSQALPIDLGRIDAKAEAICEAATNGAQGKREP